MNRALLSSSRFLPSYCSKIAPGTTTFNEYQNHGAWGMLTSFDIRNCRPDTIRSETLLRKYVHDLCTLVDMKKWGDTHIQFFGPTDAVAGYSLFQFIETSSISGHFANKTNTSYIDLFSCKPYDPKLAAEFTARFFGSNDYSYSVLLRK